MPDSIYRRTELNGIYFTSRFASWTLGNSNEKNSWQALTVSILFVLKSFMKKSIYILIVPDRII